jgi:hypothetical protein
MKKILLLLLIFSGSVNSQVTNQDLLNRIDDLEMELMIQRDMNRQVQPLKSPPTVNIPHSYIGKDVNGSDYLLYKPYLKRNKFNNIIFQIDVWYKNPILYRSKSYDTSSIFYELDCVKSQIRQTKREYIGGKYPNYFSDEDKTMYGYTQIRDEQISFFNTYKKLLCS